MPPSAAPSSCMQIIVETKTYDGGSTSAESSITKRKQLFHSSTNKEERQEHHFDAFSYYSSQSNRMSMFYDPPQPYANSRVDDDKNTTNTRRCPSTSSIETSRITATPTVAGPRRTRVSYEMHPSLIMMNAFELHEGG